jgi:nicotinamidase-related amidase
MPDTAPDTNAQPEPKTLLALAGASIAPATLANATLVIIDAQNEYLSGPLALQGAKNAVLQIAGLLQRARNAGTPIVHIAHAGQPGGAFDRSDHRGRIIDDVAPADGETLIEKPKPNAFAGTSLQQELERIGRTELIIVGFMTHMCVSSTARAAFDLGYSLTIVSQACGTRALPKPGGGVVAAQTLHDSALAALSDCFACVLSGVSEIADR